jgi:hypothetical protein
MESKECKSFLDPGPYWSVKLIVATPKSSTSTSARTSSCFDVPTGIRGRASHRNPAGNSQEIRYSCSEETNG